MALGLRGVNLKGTLSAPVLRVPVMPWKLSLLFADGFWIALPGGALYGGIQEVWGDLRERCPLRKPGPVMVML